MFNYVHIDEKRFYMSKELEKSLLLPQEQEPLRTCKSKRFITKVMVLAAVARPNLIHLEIKNLMEKLEFFRSHSRSLQTHQ